MATIRQVSVHVERTISKNYNSTKYGYGMVLDIEDGEDAAFVFDECTRSLKDQIRRQFQPGCNGESTDPAVPVTDRPETWPAIR
jgi:hypothetical protein